MRFLSIAERELRAGARQKRTHRLRWITAAVFFGLLLWLMWAFDGVRTPKIFNIFAALTFIYCIIIGTAGTADCLSSEKREGTLGLLFLTNLNGPEIIGGKLCSSALTAAYALFAIFPLLALQMLAGGITLGHFWRVVLSLADAIFFSVAMGFLASSVCLRQFTAIALASGLALFFTVGITAIIAVVRTLSSTMKPWFEVVAIFSPIYSFNSAERTRGLGWDHYWWSLLAVTGVSCICLMLATLRVSLSWRDRATGVRFWSGFRLFRSKGKNPPPHVGGYEARPAKSGVKFRRRMLGINPFFWLAGRRRVSSPVFMLLAVVIVICASYVAAPFFGRVMRVGSDPMLGQLFAWFWATLVIHALVLYYAAMVASQRLAEDKQTGALELVLSTPTTERSISRGLWMAYGRRMFFPALIAILAHFFLMWQGATMCLLDPPQTNLPQGITAGQLLWHALLNVPIRGVPLEWGFVLALRIVVLGLGLLMLVWLTLGCVGRWLGLWMKRPGFAPMTSLAIVLVPPVVFFSFVCYFVGKLHLDRMPSHRLVPIMMWMAFGIAATHYLTLSLWAGSRLRTNFRAVVTSRFQPPPATRWWVPTRRTVWRVGLGVSILVVALLTIIPSFYAWQNWRSRRAWTAFQKELKQRKESLEFSASLPGIVPDDQNFALTPAFRAWVGVNSPEAVTNPFFASLNLLDTSNSGSGLDWASGKFSPFDQYALWIAPSPGVMPVVDRRVLARNILAGLAPYEGTLRPFATDRHPSFQTFTNRDVAAVLESSRRENWALERLHMLLQIRACALLVTNRITDAAEDVLIGLRLARLARQIPDAKSSLRVQIMLMRSLQPLWEGVVEQRWTGGQLADFQNQLAEFNLLIDHTNAIRRAVLANIASWQAVAERKNQGAGAMHTHLIGGPYDYNGSLWDLQPRAWWLENCIQLYRAGENAIQKVDVPGAHVRFDWGGSETDGLPLDEWTSKLLQPIYWVSPSGEFIVFAQTALNQAIIACALERFRLAKGHYPKSLEELIPDYLRVIPNDVVRGRPMLYENNDDGRFILRSVGPNQVDDRKNPASDDWLWAFPTNAAPAAVRAPK